MGTMDIGYTLRIGLVSILLFSCQMINSQSSSDLTILSYQGSRDQLNLYYAEGNSPVILVNTTVYRVAKSCAQMRHYSGTDESKSQGSDTGNKTSGSDSDQKLSGSDVDERDNDGVTDQRDQDGDHDVRKSEANQSSRTSDGGQDRKNQDAAKDTKSDSGETAAKKSGSGKESKNSGSEVGQRQGGSDNDYKSMDGNAEQRNYKWSDINIECVKKPKSGELEIVNYFGRDPIVYYDGETIKQAKIIKK